MCLTRSTGPLPISWIFFTCASRTKETHGGGAGFRINEIRDLFYLGQTKNLHVEGANKTQPPVITPSAPRLFKYRS